jgi:hypothetical protein
LPAPPVTGYCRAGPAIVRRVGRGTPGDEHGTRTEQWHEVSRVGRRRVPAGPGRRGAEGARGGNRGAGATARSRRPPHRTPARARALAACGDILLAGGQAGVLFRSAVTVRRPASGRGGQGADVSR